MIRLRTLGECVIEVDGEPYGPDADALFAALVFLTAERGRKVSRTELAGLLWPHLPESRGRHNLRQLFYRMRIAGICVDGTRDVVTLPERHIAPTFSAGPAPERLVAERAAGTLQIGPFLPGYWPSFSQPYAEWLETARTAIEARVRRVLLQVVSALKLRAEWGEVEALATACLRLDPLNEEATLARAEATAMLGGKAEALAMIDRYNAEMGARYGDARLPATVLRRRIAERFPTPRYAGPSDRCFVGRSELMSALQTALLRARNGEGSALLLAGAPGIGKTRVADEISKAAALQGVRVVRANVDEADQHRPMSAFTDAVPQLRALPGAIGVSPESLTFLDRLTELFRPSAPPPELVDPRWIASRIRQAVVDLCDAVTVNAPLLLVVEDVHWLDASSWAALVALFDWLSSKKRALLVLTSRGPHPTPATPRRAVEKLAVHAVDALPPAAARTFVDAIVADHGGPLGEEARRWCVDVGEGNPLFLRELVIHCLEGGEIHVVPPSLRGLLHARIARLSSVARRVLEAIVLLRDYASAERVSRTLQLPAVELLTALTELSEADTVGDLANAFSPRHELLATIVVAGLPSTTARTLHRQVALALAATSSDGMIGELFASAEHWHAAGDDVTAARHLASVGSALGRIGAISDSANVLERAIQYTTDPLDRRRLTRRLAECFAYSAQWSRAKSLLDTLRRNPEHDTHDDSARDEILGVAASYHTDSESPALLFARAYQVAADERLRGSTRLYAARAGIGVAANAGTPTQIRQLWAAIQPVIDRESLSTLEVLPVKLIVETEAGSLERGVEAAAKLRAISNGETDPLTRVAGLNLAAEGLRMAGLYREAVEVFEQVVTDADRIGAVYLTARATQVGAELLLDLDQLHAAGEWIARAQSVISGLESAWHNDAMIIDRVRLALALGDTALGIRLAKQLRTNTDLASARSIYTYRACLTTLIEAELAAASGPVSAELLERLDALHKEHATRCGHDRVAVTLARSLDRLGMHDDRRRMITEYVSSHRRSLAPWAWPELMQ